MFLARQRNNSLCRILSGVIMRFFLPLGRQALWTARCRNLEGWDAGLRFTLSGTTVSDERIEVRGPDFLEFVDGKITRRDSFWKIVQ